VIHFCDIAAAQADEADAAPVEREDRRAVDAKPLPRPVELADDKPRRDHAHDNAPVDRLPGSSAGRREDEGSAKEHEPEPSHAGMLAEPGQGSVCCV
jgi:hypothetical protein